MASVDVTPALPVNGTTGEGYSGGNVPVLLAAAVDAGYSGSQWAGFKQWLTVGRVVRKGEHGTHCRRVITFAADDSGDAKRGVRGFVVFHRDQTDELTR